MKAKPSKPNSLAESQEVSAAKDQARAALPEMVPKSLTQGVGEDFSRRPEIPAHIAREVLGEAGHRCAVCGTPSPLEKAHIVAWSTVRRHDATNLICLCANCHQRSHAERWGERTLSYYKQNPWITRCQSDREPRRLAQVQLTIDMSLDEFDERSLRMLQHALAGFLEISPLSVKVVKIEEGSVKVTLEIPEEAGRKIDSDVNRMVECLRPLQIVQVAVWFSELFKDRTEYKSVRGRFEDDETYIGRLEREANERIIQDATGDKPTRGFFESVEDYTRRIAHDANGHIVEKASGSRPRKSRFDDDESYQEKIAQEANEYIIIGATGFKPKRERFESGEDYRNRIAHEASELIIEAATGSKPIKGRLESDTEFRMRVAAEAKKIKASCKREAKNRDA